MFTNMNVAIDVEDTLADVEGAVASSSNELTEREIFDSWLSDDKGGETYQIYMGITDSMWRHNPETIPLTENGVAEFVSEINECADRVDIVTNREHVDDSIIWWLEEHGIEYDEFVSTDRPKHELDYSVYVDDNPRLFGECRLLLYDQPWNAQLADDSSKQCDRIYSLAEVVEFLGCRKV